MIVSTRSWMYFKKLKIRFRSAILFVLFLCATYIFYINVTSFTRLEKKDLGIYILDTEEIRPLFNFYLRPWKTETAITSSNPCGQKLNIRYSMVFVVKSAITNKNRRDVIRATWGNVKVLDDVSFETVFILGNSSDSVIMQKVANENNKYGDILQFDAEDIPKNVPEKVLAGMQWAASTLPPQWFYASIDDDIIVNQAKLVNFFGRLIGEKYTNINGNIQFSSMPIACVYSYQDRDRVNRETDSKWYMPKENFPGKYWPIYCRGGMYTTSSNMVKNLYEVSRRTPRLYLDDVWITGFMRLKVQNTDENILDAPGSRLTEKQLHSNSWLSPTIVHHFWGNIADKKVNVPEAMFKMWKSTSKPFQSRILCSFHAD